MPGWKSHLGRRPDEFVERGVPPLDPRAAAARQGRAQGLDGTGTIGALVNDFYDEDLAYVHAAGFSGLSLAGGDVVLELLRTAGLSGGAIVDLGCGSGEWAAQAVDAGFDVLGVDVSPAMLRLAGSRAPEARFVRTAASAAALPPCVAVTAFGEAFCYAAPDLPDLAGMRSLFARANASLAPRGLLVFDVLVTGPGLSYRNWSAGDDWAVLVEVREDAGDAVLERDITVFRDAGAGYRRSFERHRLRVWEPASLQASLEELGFSVTTSRRYGDFELGPRRLAFFARAPER
jgi:SAM-dependent methyltransferase